MRFFLIFLVLLSCSPNVSAQCHSASEHLRDMQTERLPHGIDYTKYATVAPIVYNDKCTFVSAEVFSPENGDDIHVAVDITYKYDKDTIVYVGRSVRLAGALAHNACFVHDGEPIDINPIEWENNQRIAGMVSGYLAYFVGDEQKKVNVYSKFAIDMKRPSLATLPRYTEEVRTPVDGAGGQISVGLFDGNELRVEYHIKDISSIDKAYPVVDVLRIEGKDKTEMAVSEYKIADADIISNPPLKYSFSILFKYDGNYHVLKITHDNSKENYWEALQYRLDNGETMNVMRTPKIISRP